MFSSKDFNPAIVLVGLEAIESLYHFAPFISFTNSSLCSTPGNLLIAFAWFSTFTNLLVAAIAAHIFSALCTPLNLIFFVFTICLLKPFSHSFIILSSNIIPLSNFSLLLKYITFAF